MVIFLRKSLSILYIGLFLCCVACGDSTMTDLDWNNINQSVDPSAIECCQLDEPCEDDLPDCDDEDVEEMSM